MVAPDNASPVLSRMMLFFSFRTQVFILASGLRVHSRNDCFGAAGLQYLLPESLSRLSHNH